MTTIPVPLWVLEPSGRRVTGAVQELLGPRRAISVRGGQRLARALQAAGFELRVEPPFEGAVLVGGIADAAALPSRGELEPGSPVVNLVRVGGIGRLAGVGGSGTHERVAAAFLAAGLVDIVQRTLRGGVLLTAARVPVY